MLFLLGPAGRPAWTGRSILSLSYYIKLFLSKTTFQTAGRMDSIDLRMFDGAILRDRPYVFLRVRIEVAGGRGDKSRGGAG